MIFLMWHIPYRRGEYTLEIVWWTSRAWRFQVQTKDALRGCILTIDTWDKKWFLHLQWCIVGMMNKPIVGGGMTSHQWMRVFDLSLPETQTQLLSKIESNSYMIMIYSSFSALYYLLGKGATGWPINKCGVRRTRSIN